ncbi:unnamed protein product [Brassica rapa subsp. narinosa]
MNISWQLCLQGITRYGLSKCKRFISSKPSYPNATQINELQH